MLTKVIAPYGYGKTEYLFSKISEAFGNKKTVFVIVPEQAANEYEKEIVKKFGNESNEYIFVTNFSRLPDVVLRNYGDIARNYLSDSAKKLAYGNAVLEMLPTLSEIKTFPTTDFLEKIIGEIEALKSEGVGENKLFELCENDDIPDTLKNKLSDLAKISAAFSENIKGAFDDSTNEMAHLAEILDTFRFFEKSEVFIDSFWDFTFDENELIKRIAYQADNVYISVTCDRISTRRASGETPVPSIFAKGQSVLRKLHSMCAKAGIKECDIYLEDNLKKEMSDIEFFARNLISGKIKKRGETDKIKLVSCKNAYEEAEFCAVNILKEIHAGKKWNEIAVLSRSGENAPLFSLVFKKYGIPNFFDSTENLLSSPIAKTVLISLRIASKSDYPEDVLRLVTETLVPASVTDAYSLQKYIKLWKLQARDLMAPKEFDKHPEGIVEWRENDTRSINELCAVNRAKKAIFEPISRLSYRMFNSNAEEKTLALIDFMKEMKLEKTVNERISLFKSKENHDGAAREIRMWNAVLEAISDIFAILGKKEIDGETFVKMVEAAFSGKKTGSVPPVQDAVMIGKAGFSRTDGKKVIFMTGISQGKFPQTNSDDRIISFSDRKRMNAAGCELKEAQDERINEYFLFYLGSIAAKEKLYVSFSGESGSDGTEPKNSISLIGNRLIMLFENMKAEVFDPEKEMPLTKEALFGFLCRTGKLKYSDNEREKLSNMLLHDENYREKLLDAQSSVDYAELIPELKKIKPYEKENIRLSYSSFDKYSRCRYSYYAKYLLRLKEPAKSEIGFNHTGSCIHAVMEKVLSHLKDTGKNIFNVTESELFDLNKKAIWEYAASIKGFADSARNKKLISNIEKNTYLMLLNIREELEKSGFSPIFFEKKLDTLENPYKIMLSDGTSLSFTGSIDRVDFCRDKNLVRVVDYKTGGEDFGLEKVQNNIGVQMLIYLFALICGKFSCGNEYLSPEPYGIMYINGSWQLEKATTRKEIAKKDKDAKTPFNCNGLLIDNTATPDNHGKIKIGDNDSYTVINTAKFEKLRGYVESNFKKLMDELKNGNIAPNPLKDSKNSACKYCSYKAICKRQEQNLRTIGKFDEKQFWGEENG